MKKIISLILLCAVALGLCACGDANIQPRFVGKWENEDGTATLTLKDDGTAIFVLNDVQRDDKGKVLTDEAGNPLPDTANGTYTFTWTATSNSNITIKWIGEPIPAPVTEDEAEETTAPVEETTPAEEGADAAEGEAAEATTAGTTTKRDDPSIVGYGSMTVKNGEMVLTLSEGSSTDILLFQFVKEQALIKVA